MKYKTVYAFRGHNCICKKKKNLGLIQGNMIKSFLIYNNDKNWALKLKKNIVLIIIPTSPGIFFSVTNYSDWIFEQSKKWFHRQQTIYICF